jgi:hypothetical protein
MFGVSLLSSDALSQIEHERSQCAMYQRRVDEVISSFEVRRTLSLQHLIQSKGRGVAACGAAWHDGFEGARQVCL